MNQGKYAEAAEVFTKGIKIDDNFRYPHVTQYAMRATCYSYIKKYKESIQDYKKAPAEHSVSLCSSKPRHLACCRSVHLIGQMLYALDKIKIITDVSQVKFMNKRLALLKVERLASLKTSSIPYQAVRNFPLDQSLFL